MWFVIEKLAGLACPTHEFGTSKLKGEAVPEPTFIVIWSILHTWTCDLGLLWSMYKHIPHKACRLSFSFRSIIPDLGDVDILYLLSEFIIWSDKRHDKLWEQGSSQPPNLRTNNEWWNVNKPSSLRCGVDGGEVNLISKIQTQISSQSISKLPRLGLARGILHRDSWEISRWSRFQILGVVGRYLPL